MQIENKLTEALVIEFPMIMAPMFLVSNEEMIISAMRNGIAGAFPSLNFRKNAELEKLLDNLNRYKENSKGTYGVNLIVQKTNILYEKHLEICVRKKVPFYVTSLGNPKEVVEKAHSYGAKVFCDVTNLEHAAKASSVGCDGFIAVGQGAGGHAGQNSLQVLIPALKKNFSDKIIIGAGGVATGEGILSLLSLGAAGVSVGTRFIASLEANVNQAYKNAVVNSGMGDIVMTEKISGTPCTIINTPYTKKIGYKRNFLEKFLSKNKRTKKWFKMIVQLKGMKWLEKSAVTGNYNELWCAGQSVELINDVKSCDEIVGQLKKETFDSFSSLNKLIK